MLHICKRFPSRSKDMSKINRAVNKSDLNGMDANDPLCLRIRAINRVMADCMTEEVCNYGKRVEDKPVTL